MFQRHAFLIGAFVGTLCAAGIHVVPAVAQGTLPEPTPAEAGIPVPHCMVTYINKTRVPAESQGKLTQLNVEEGMLIKKGDVIAVVDDRQSLLVLKQKESEELEAKLNAKNDVNKRDAVNGEKIARAEFETYKDLYEKGAAPYWEMKKKELEADRALLRIELADLNADVAMAVFMQKQAGTDLAKSDIEMRTIRAEFDAFVENRIAQRGEWVQPGSPIVEIVQMDQLRVEGFIDALEYAGQIRRGSPVHIEVIVGRTAEGAIVRSFQGTIGYVSTEIDLNKKHRIWVSIPNERVGEDWLIKPGMSASMRILPATANGGELF